MNWLVCLDKESKSNMEVQSPQHGERWIVGPIIKVAWHTADCYPLGMETDWIEHRRAFDGERMGWMKPVGEGFVAIDLLGRHRTGIVDWLDAEETLDELGIGYLGDLHELKLADGQWLRVRIGEVSTDLIRVKQDDGGDMTAPQIWHTLLFPVSEDELRPLAR